MSAYIELKDYAKYLEIKSGDLIFISSDASHLLMDAMSHKKTMDLNVFIDGLLEAVGTDGTVVFPTYNWDFCKGIPFDYRRTPCKTGVLGTVALKRDDFRRTRHPIYSFAVSGKYQDSLCALENVDSFGIDSPFSFFKEHNAVNYIIDIEFEHCFTFVHFAEQQSGRANYRYIKNFTADYVDMMGIKNQRTYSMFVRNLELDVKNTVDPIEEDFLLGGAEKIYIINSSKIKRIDFAKAYEILLDDIQNNRSRKICAYSGQDDE